MITTIQCAPDTILTLGVLSNDAQSAAAAIYDDAPDDPYKDWAGCEAASFIPNTRQQPLINAVANAVDGGLFYTNEVVAKVAEILEVTPEVMAENTARVEHGNFGYDVYFARKTLEAQRTQAKRIAVKAQLRLVVGGKLGTIMFSDYKRVNATVVEAISENGMSITVIGKRGSLAVRGQLCPLQFKSVIERAHEQGARKDSYSDFIAARNPDRKAPAPKGKARAEAAPLSEKELAQLVADAQDLQGAAARKGITLDSGDEARERAAARAHFDLGTWLYYYSTRVGRSDGLESRIDCLRRLFEAGIYQPGYQFFTAFDFGERTFDTCVEMGDADLVIDGLRDIAHRHKNPNLLKAFEHMGWSLERKQRSLF